MKRCKRYWVFVPMRIKSLEGPLFVLMLLEDPLDGGIGSAGMLPYDAFARVESFLFGVSSCFTVSVSFFLGVVYNILFIAVMKVVNWPAIDGAVSSLTALVGWPASFLKSAFIRGS